VLHVQEAYHVVSRLSGLIIAFPRVLWTERSALYPVNIDLWPSQVSGRKQPAPISMAQDHVLLAVQRQPEESVPGPAAPP